MKCSSRICHHPYAPLSVKLDAPYICRLAPDKNSLTLEWFDKGNGKEYTLFIRIRGTEEWQPMTVSVGTVVIDKLSCDTEYELYIESDTGKKSNVRLSRTGAIPEGTSVINYLHPEDEQYLFSGRYLCSPSLVRTNGGRLIAGMDVFGPAMGQNTTLLFCSDDNGESWHYLCDLYPFYWGSLFFHQDKVYIIGLTTEYGNLQISCSNDEGKTWEKPTIILYGSNALCATGGISREPMHLTKYKGRLYTSLGYGSWKSGGHIPAVLSIDCNADPMIAENWTISELATVDERWYNDAGKRGEGIEGNLVVYPDGKLYDCLRWRRGEMLRLRVNTDRIDQAPEYVAEEYAPVSNSLFRIIPSGNQYYLLTNRKSVLYNDYLRNVLSLFQTEDLKHFRFLRDVVNFEVQSPRKFGFQYPSFLLEDKTLYTTIRSAFNNADSFHNSNYILFSKIAL